MRDDERLTCDIQPVRGGFEVVWTQDGEHHVELFAEECQAEARSRCVEEDLIHDGWSVLQPRPAPSPATPPRRPPCPQASDDGNAG